MARYIAHDIYRTALEGEFSDVDAVTATAVALATSGGRTDFIGEVFSQTREFGPAVGLWGLRSLQPRALAEATGADAYRVPDKLLDPYYNAELAKLLFEAPDGGWDRWTAYRNGKYRKYMDVAQEEAP